MALHSDPAPGQDADHEPERFHLGEEDLEAVAEIVKLIRSRMSSMTPADLRATATVLLALERLPRATPGLSVSLEFSTPDRDGNRGWADLELDDREFRLGAGERFYSPSVGGDTVSRIVFETRAGSDWQRGDIIDWLPTAQSIATWERISVTDESWDSVHEMLEKE